MRCAFSRIAARRPGAADADAPAFACCGRRRRSRQAGPRLQPASPASSSARTRDVFRLQHPATDHDLAWRAPGRRCCQRRWLPRPESARPLRAFVATIGDEVASPGCRPNCCDYCSPNTRDDCLETWKATLPHRAAPGRLRPTCGKSGVNGEQIGTRRGWRESGGASVLPGRRRPDGNGC